MKSLHYCRQQVALYSREQLVLLEQSMEAWVDTSETAVQVKLAADIRDASRQLDLLAVFIGADAVRHARDMKRVCLLLLARDSEIREPDLIPVDPQAGTLQLLTEFYSHLSQLHNALTDLSR